MKGEEGKAKGKGEKSLQFSDWPKLFPSRRAGFSLPPRSTCCPEALGLNSWDAQREWGDDGCGDQERNLPVASA